MLNVFLFPIIFADMHRSSDQLDVEFQVYTACSAIEYQLKYCTVGICAPEYSITGGIPPPPVWAKRVHTYTQAPRHPWFRYLPWRSLGPLPLRRRALFTIR